MQFTSPFSVDLQGSQSTQLPSVTMRCVTNPAVQSFTVYPGMGFARSGEDFTRYDLLWWTGLVLDAQATLALCPMSALIPETTRMRPWLQPSL